MVKGKLLIIILYVDDLILTGDDQLIVSCKEDLAREFEMKDMGLQLLPWHGSVAEGWGVVCVSGQVCQRDTQEIPHGEV